MDIDLGLTHFAVLSGGEKIASLRFLRRAEKLKRAQRSLARKKPGSSSREKARHKVARVGSSQHRAMKREPTRSQAGQRHRRREPSSARRARKSIGVCVARGPSPDFRLPRCMRSLGARGGPATQDHTVSRR
ncbi:transposase [Streptomyces sp. NPDC006173]|uniref:transposase n=1 Tax=Streptomyces sp. NPDC006173 TaxID=3155349 RepID=UPI0033C768DC